MMGGTDQGFYGERIADEIEIEHYFCNGVYLKRSLLKKGMKYPQHKHTFSHIGMLASGVVKVIGDGMTRTSIAPAYITLRNDVEHEVVALADSVWFCVHITDETDASKIDETLIGKD